MTHYLKHGLAIFAVVLLSGCASTGNHPQDPFEGMNRAMFQVNEGLDTVLLKPVAKVYDTVTPDLVQTGVTNFFSNIGDVWIAVNNLLQGKIQEAASDIARVLVNSGIGVFGLFDVASHLELEKHSADFGETLAVWGVGEGPYLFIPILGPRTTRDAFGAIADFQADPVWQVNDVPVRNSLTGLRAVNNRARLFPAEKVLEEAAIDKYNYLRDAYLKARRYEVFDGNPPKEVEAP